MEKITFVTDDGGKEEFYVEEQNQNQRSQLYSGIRFKGDEANAIF